MTRRRTLLRGGIVLGAPLDSWARLGAASQARRARPDETDAPALWPSDLLVETTAAMSLRMIGASKNTSGKR